MELFPHLSDIEPFTVANASHAYDKAAPLKPEMRSRGMDECVLCGLELL